MPHGTLRQWLRNLEHQVRIKQTVSFNVNGGNEGIGGAGEVAHGGCGAAQYMASLRGCVKW